MSDGPDTPQDETRRPRSVREGLPAAGGGGSGGSGRSGSGDGPTRPGGPLSARDAMQGEDEGGRPTPVREAMEVERETPQPIEPPSVTFEVGGQDWIARVEGRTTTGLPADAGAPLLFLTFARAEEPERRLLEITTVGRRLDDIGAGRLGALLEDARPHPEEWEPGDFFPETRKSRQSRR